MNPTIRRGDTGPAVADLQRALGVDDDGVFGPMTEKALRDWQAAHGLDVDGVAGPVTWAALTPAGSPSLAARAAAAVRSAARRAGDVPGATWGKPLPSQSRRGVEPDEIVIHESVTATAADAVAVLARRKLSVHFAVDRDGTVTQHVPLAKSAIHAGGRHNRRSIAIEVANAYYGDRAREGDDVISAAWAHRGRYILPTREQCEAVWRLVQELTTRLDGIPLAWPGADGSRFVWGRIPRDEVPGIMAHHRWQHADGLFVEYYCLLRHAAGMDAWAAYGQAKADASARERLTPVPAHASRGLEAA